MADIVRVPGNHHGGWHYDLVVPALEATGYRVIAPMLTGPGEHGHLARNGINLDAHVEGVVQAFADRSLTNSVLVDHSYGGLVITTAV